MNKAKKETSQYWMVFAGLGYAGMTAETNFHCFHYATKEEAEAAAYEASVERLNSEGGMHGIPTVTEDPDALEAGEDEEGNEVISPDEMDSYLDYFAEIVSQKQLDNHGVEDEFISFIADSIGDDPAEVCKNLGISYEAR
jgi:hypothetical protein